jgi:hypothetical protein
MREDELSRIWIEQSTFNRQLRPAPVTYADRTAQTKELCLHLMSEVDELLRAGGAWKSHRRQTVLENPAAVRMELADIFKLMVSVADVWSITPEELIHDFWTKSMVMRQLYSQEWVHDLTRPCVVIDIDSVLADYVAGFTEWAVLTGHLARNTADHLVATRPYINQISLGIPEAHWLVMQHLFRISGAKSKMPLMPGAREFLLWCRMRGWMIVLMTSRRIDQYPNIHGDTVRWLSEKGLTYDVLWWAREKGREVVKNLDPAMVRFFLDDNLHFINQFKDLGIRAYWLSIEPTDRAVYGYKVQSLGDVIKLEEERG